MKIPSIVCLTLFAVILIPTALCLSKKSDKKQKSERITYFYFGEHGSMALSGENYSIKRMDDRRVQVIIDDNLPSKTEFTIDDTTIFDELLSIVKTNKMDKYKNNYKPKMEIFDGDSWSLYYTYNSGRSVNSGGYMAWPDNYPTVRESLEKLFQKLRNYRTISYIKLTIKNTQGCDIEYTLERGNTETTVTLHDAERGTDKTIKVDNDKLEDINYKKEAMQLVGFIKMEDDVPDKDGNATRSTYSLKFNSGETVSGVTCRPPDNSLKIKTIRNFFKHWFEK